MRVTNKAMVRSYLSDLNNNLKNMSSIQEQLSSGKEIRRPSDNPFKVARTMELSTSIAENERYKTNIAESVGWLETSDDALGQLNDALQRVRELTISSGNGSHSDLEKLAIKQEMTQLKAQIVQIGNSSYDGRYLFGGDETTVAPFDASGNYVGSTTGLVREFSPGVTMTIGATGNNFTGVINSVSKIINDLSGPGTPVSNLSELDTQIDNVLSVRSKIGADINRLDSMKEKNESESYNMTELLSKTSDIDIAEKYMQYKVLENVYNSSLETGAKILQPSLLDFIR